MRSLSKTALVTGATGYIGMALCEHLQVSGWNVIGVARNHVCGPWTHFISRDLAMEGLSPEELNGVDIIYHTAGKAHALAELNQSEDTYFKINTRATEALLKVAETAGVNGFVFFSSIKAMGEGGAEPSNETTDTSPITAYGRSKLMAEAAVLDCKLPHKSVLRLSLVYGGHTKGNMHKMLAAVARNRFPPLADVHNRRSMVCIHDVVRAAVLCGTDCRANGECFILTDGKYYSTRDLFKLMSVALNKPIPRWNVPVWTLRCGALLGDCASAVLRRRIGFDSETLDKLIGSSAFSSAKIQHQLGFIPAWDFQRALPQMVSSL